MSVVTIGATSWAITLATSSADLLAGLSGIASLDAQTGMLFDMGNDQSAISINMNAMLFSLDIVFVSAAGSVVGVLRNVAPGDEVAFNAGGGAGARYFMEVNANEAIGVNIGDSVQIVLDEEPPSSIIPDSGTLISTAVVVGMMGMMMKMMGRQL